MGFYIRKSFKCGPIRFNLSKSGIGTSIGFKGLRYGIDGKGRDYVHAGRYGLYSKSFLNKSDNSSAKIASLYNTEDIPPELKQSFPFIARIIVLTIFSPIILIALTAGIGLIFSQEIFEGILVSLFGIVPIWGLIFATKLKICDNATDGYNAYKHERYYKAIEKFEKILSKYSLATISESSQIWLKNITFLAYIKIEDYEGAIDFIEEYPTRGSREKLTACYYFLKQYAKLINHIQSEYTQIDKDNHPATYAMLGEAFLNLGKKDIALETMLQGPLNKRKMNDEMCAYRYTLAKCYEANAMVNEALKQYNKIYSYDINYEDVSEKINQLTEYKE